MMGGMRLLTVLFGLIVPLICGLAIPSAGEPRVVGGTRAAQGEFPWVVRLSIGCGGSLITEQVVLTAAHCIPGGTGPSSSITATVGVVDLADQNATRVRSAFVYKAADYTAYEKGSDWALIKLAEPVPILAKPTISLPTTKEHDKGEFTIMGWGADREGGYQQRWLLKAQVPDVDDLTCGTSYRESGAGFVDEAMLCAGLFGTGGVDTCQGDSGGPMVIRTAEDAFVQVGIVSWGHGCGQARFPGVYTEVSTYAEKINKAARELMVPAGS